MNSAWHLFSPKLKVLADLIKINDATLTLKRQDNGKEVDALIDKISDADIDYVNNLK